MGKLNLVRGDVIGKRLSKRAIRNHLRTAGQDYCPYCKSSTEDNDSLFEVSELDPVENGSIEQIITCTICGRKWMDVFELVAIKELA